MKRSPSPQLILHIGDPKTGTTSIQHALERNLLRCETRVATAWTHGNNVVNAIPLTKVFHPEQIDRREFLFNQVRVWLDSTAADYAIISSELFFRTDPIVLQQTIGSHLSNYSSTTKVIAYVRPHASRFLAAYMQRTKTGQYLRDFEDFLPAIRKIGTLDYMPRFGRWKEVFGDRFVLRPFLRTELRGEDSVMDFFSEVLEGESFTLSESLQLNVSLPQRTLSGLRFFHRRLAKEGAQYGIRSNLARAIFSLHLPSDSIRGAGLSMDRATAGLLVEAYRDDAGAIDNAFFGRSLLKAELEDCIQSAEESPVDLSAERHFDPAERRQLLTLIRELGRLAVLNQIIWTTHFQVTRGVIVPKSEQLRRILKHKPKLEQIDALLVEVAEVLRG